MIEIISSFKDRFNEALSIRQMKPIELSERTGISESTISQYRSGYAKPKDDKLVSISNALGVNPVWLMGLNVPMEVSESTQDIEIGYDTKKVAEAMQMFNIYENASPELKQGIDSLIELARKIQQIPHLDGMLPQEKDSEQTQEIPHLKKDTK